METMNFRLRHMEARMCSSVRKKKQKKIHVCSVNKYNCPYFPKNYRFVEYFKASENYIEQYLSSQTCMTLCAKKLTQNVAGKTIKQTFRQIT